MTKLFIAYFTRFGAAAIVAFTRSSSFSTPARSSSSSGLRATTPEYVAHPAAAIDSFGEAIHSSAISAPNFDSAAHQATVNEHRAVLVAAFTHFRRSALVIFGGSATSPARYIAS